LTLNFDHRCVDPGNLVPPTARPITLAQLLHATETMKSEPFITLAVAIQKQGLLNPHELDVLMREDPQLLQSRSFELVGRLLLTHEELHRALARTAGVVEVDAARFEIPPNALDIIPLDALRMHDLLYLGEIDKLLFIASWRPTGEDMHSHLFALTSRSVRVVWADRDAIVQRLGRMDSIVSLRPLEYERQPPHEPVVHKKAGHLPLAGGMVAPKEQDMEHLMAEAVQDLSSGLEREEVSEVNEASSMVRMVKRLIMGAKALHASDIHIETNPGEEFTRIRLRRDGDLELYQTIPPQLHSAIVSRIKVMARLDISERRRPQDGKITFSDSGDTPLELRVAIMPTHDGMEDVVMRLLASSHPVSLATLSLQPRDAQVLARMSARSFGLILTAGPTGSGKTTTLHSVLAEMNTAEKKIWTAEDPIEITQQGLRQVQVNPRIGLTFASAMRGFLRADPDIIMIGEIRDQETAKIVIEGALTGHLVLSTLHTNSACESVVRLLDLGMDTLNFADSLVGIVAQRLVRSLCPHCAQERALSPGRFAEAVQEYVQDSPLTQAEGAQRLLAAAGVTEPDQLREKTALGCARCEGKGYKGRTGIYEILENNPALRLLIQRNARPAEIYAEAIRSGMHSLRHDALEKWLQGLIDLPQARLAFL